MANAVGVPTRILHITGRSDHGGGPEHILHVLTASENRLVTSFVACPSNGLYWERYRHLIGSDNLCPIPHRRISLRSILRIIRFVRANGIQVVHSHGMSGGIYGRLIRLLAGIPCVHTFHGLPRTLSFKHTLYYHAERVLSRYTKLGIAVSPGEYRLITRRYPMYAGRITVVKNGIETSDGEGKARSARMPNIGPAKRDIVSFTRLNEQKNPWLVIDIAKELRARNELSDIRFCLYGEKVDDPSFRELVESADLTEHIRLSPPTDNPALILSKAFAYLSTSRWEGMPLSLLEAHREGTCVIASKVIGNRDLIANGLNGMLYSDGDARSAANCIISIKHDPELRFNLRRLGAFNCSENHNRKFMAARLQLIYQIIREPKLAAQRLARERRSEDKRVRKIATQQVADALASANLSDTPSTKQAHHIHTGMRNGDLDIALG